MCKETIKHNVDGLAIPFNCLHYWLLLFIDYTFLHDSLLNQTFSRLKRIRRKC